MGAAKGIVDFRLFSQSRKSLEQEVPSLPLVTVLIAFVQERFDKVLRFIRFSLTSDADNQFYRFTSEFTREKIKTKMIGMVESLLNEEDLRATSSSHEIVEAAKQDVFLLKQSKNGK